MLSDKPKLIFTNMLGKVITVAEMPQLRPVIKESLTPEQAYLKALYNVGEALK